MISVDSGSTASYVYDAFGRRAEKAVASGGLYGATQEHYWYDTAGRIRTIWSQNGSWIVDHFYFGPEYVGSYSTFFVFKDALGSRRLLTAVNQSVSDALDYMPYGEQIAGATDTNLKFTGLERDQESDFDHTLFRQSSNSAGRWMSPDPGNAGASPLNPQTWNMYAYVENNPTTRVDPLGLGDFCTPQGYCEPGSENACMAGEYGCAGTPSEIDAGEQNYVAENCIGCVSFDGYTFRSFAAWADFSTNEAVLTQDETRDAQAMQSQIDRTKANVAADFPGNDLGIDYNDYVINGGNLDFSCEFCGVTVKFGRYDNGIHIPGGDRAHSIHDDTASWWTNNSIWSFNPWNLAEHFWVDVVLGNLWYDVIPR